MDLFPANIPQKETIVTTKHLVAAMCVCVTLSVLNALAGDSAPDKVAAMSESERAEFFRAFLAENGKTCVAVSRTFYQGTDQGGTATWNASCEGAEDWVINVGISGAGKILDCKRGYLLGTGAPCFTKPQPKEATPPTVGAFGSAVAPTATPPAN